VVVVVAEVVVAVAEVTGISGLLPAVEVEEADMVEDMVAAAEEDLGDPKLMAAVLRTAVEEVALAGGKYRHPCP
jgi:hypothetical protein